MNILSEEAQSDISACSPEYLSTADISEALYNRIKAALDAHEQFFKRAEISWEISLPTHRKRGEPLTRRGEEVYSGEHLLYTTSKLRTQDKTFIQHILDKNKVIVA